MADLDCAVDLRHTCGYITVLKTGARHGRATTTNATSNHVYRGQPSGNDVFDKLSLESSGGVVDFDSAAVSPLLADVSPIGDSGTGRLIDTTLEIKGQIAPNFNWLPINSTLPVRYVCSTFITEYFIFI